MRTSPVALMPCTWKTDLAMSRPIVVTVLMGCSSAAARSGRHFEVSVAFVVRLMAAYRTTGSLAPKPEGGWRYFKLDPDREFIIRRVREKGDITMPHLVAELAALGTTVTPASISHWLIRQG